jgi:hypothetical protein
LHVIGASRQVDRRADDQLQRRAGRQGQPGSSQFFLSRDDELAQCVEEELARSPQLACELLAVLRPDLPSPAQAGSEDAARRELLALLWGGKDERDPADRVGDAIRRAQDAIARRRLKQAFPR